MPIDHPTRPESLSNRAVCLLIGLHVSQLHGCSRDAPPPPVAVDDMAEGLELIFPESLKSWGEGNDPKLTVDGKDHGAVMGTRRRLLLQPEVDGKRVKIVFSYWPNGHTHIIRSREVAYQKGKRVEVDLRAEDPAFPDQIKATFSSTPPHVAEKMCAVSKVGKNDVVYDIGCGDGRLIITALEQFHARRGVGIDIDPDLIKLCRENARTAGVADRAEFRVQDALKLDNLSEASVVLLCVGEQLNEKLRPILQKTLKPGARVVSHRFKIPGWEPDQTFEVKPAVKGETRFSYQVLLWTIKDKN